MKGHASIFLSHMLLCGVLSAQTDESWIHQDKLGNIVIVEDLKDLKFPFDTTFITENLVGPFFPSDLHETGTPYRFRIIDVTPKGRKQFDIRASPAERFPDPNVLHGIGVVLYRLTLRKVKRGHYEIKDFKPLHFEI